MEYQKLLDEFNKENGTYFMLKQDNYKVFDKKGGKVVDTYSTYIFHSLMTLKGDKSIADIARVEFGKNALISGKQMEDTLKEVIKDYGKLGYVSTETKFEVPEGCKVIHLGELDLKGDK